MEVQKNLDGGAARSFDLDCNHLHSFVVGHTVDLADSHLGRSLPADSRRRSSVAGHIAAGGRSSDRRMNRKGPT